MLGSKQCCLQGGLHVNSKFMGYLRPISVHNKENVNKFYILEAYHSFTLLL
jgi:hypothetical protein